MVDRQYAHFSLLFALAIWAISKQNPSMRDTKSELCLIGSLVGTERGSGTGNLFFELINFIAIAKQYNRTPVIRDKYTISRLDELRPIFPNLNEILPTKKINCGREKRVVLRSGKCCVFEEDILHESNLTRGHSLNVEFYYLQSYKYFHNISSIDVPHILSGSKTVSSIAKTEILDRKILEKSKFNICVHVRRGDYMLSWRHEPTRDDFTIAVTQHLMNKYANYTPTTVILGNDPKWAERVLKGMDVHIAPYSPFNPSNVDWEFSRLYCDVVALTASASTYGWWLGYVSRGGRVYYNRRFSQPFGIELELNPDDFFPPTWTSLFLKNQRVYEL